MVRNLAYTVFALFIFTIPVEGTLLLEGVGTISRLVGLIAFPLCLLYIVWRGRLRFHWLIFWFALLVCWAAITLLWSRSDDPLLAVLTPAQLLLLVWLIFQMIETPRQVEMVFTAYVLGCSVSAISTINNYLSGDVSTYQRFAASGFNPNDIAMILALGLPMAVFLVLRGRWLWTIGLAYVPLGMYAIVLTASRGGFIAAVTASIYPLLLVNDRTVRTKVLMFLALAAAAAVGGVSSVPETSLVRIATTWTELSQGNLNGRTLIWAGGLDMVNQHPILGVGLGSFSSALYQYAGFSQVAHNAFVAIVAELGLIGLAIFVATLGSVVWGLRRLPLLERRLWYTLLMVLGVAFMSANFEMRKQSWLILALAASHSVAFSVRRSPSAHPLVAVQGQADPLHRLPSGPRGSTR